MRVLVVDDEKRILAAMTKALVSLGYEVETAGSPDGALKALKSREFDVLISDLVMPGMNGLELLRKASALRPSLPVIILTGHGTIESAVAAMKEGAFDYVTKPFNVDEVALILRRAVEHNRLIAENIMLKTRLERRTGYHNLVGGSEAMQEVYRLIERLKDTESTVLIEGESGTGKELIAKAIHYSGNRGEFPFVTVDCGSITESLLESELFGHVKGAFTGAHRDRAGYFEAADRGTVFLDEIGEFSYHLQTRLLRVLQDGEFTRVGDHRTIRTSARVIAATNRDLEAAVGDGAFREDLFYRLNVITIKVPPLRQRRDDIPMLADHFVQKYSRRLKRTPPEIAPDALARLSECPWHGNVRELENAIEKVITLVDETTIRAHHLPGHVRSAAQTVEPAAGPAPAAGPTDGTYRDAKRKVLDDFSRDYITGILKAYGGNISAAARHAGMDRGCFYRLVKKLDIEIDRGG
ncbi:MAG: sigma-54 dependent transcriptional regulator [bacterium]